MLKVERKQLELVSSHLDTKNPKIELNYLFVDSENMVSTNTKALTIVKHFGELEENIYIHNSIVKLALKQTKARYFEIDNDFIECLNSSESEIICISSEAKKDKKDYKYPEYKRIIPKKIKLSVPFTNISQIAGIVAYHKTIIDAKQIPTFKGYDLICYSLRLQFCDTFY